MATARNSNRETVTSADHLAIPSTAELESRLQQLGHAHLPDLLSPEQCQEIALLYQAAELFRSRVVMARHGFGRGEYQYFSYPLPSVIETLRHALYPHLAAIANCWQEQLGTSTRYATRLTDFLKDCHQAGQIKPTPLMLRYGAGDFNCLHQDVYGPLIFPLQVAILLSQPGADFEGGEFVLTEQRPRQQSRVSVVPLRQGDAVIFPVRERPVIGTRGPYRAQLRHGVSQIRVGNRYTLGLIFHDAA